MTNRITTTTSQVPRVARYVPPSAAPAKMPSAASSLASSPVLRLPTVNEVLTPEISKRDLIKSFRFVSWKSKDGKMRSGRIIRRNRDTVSVLPFDAEPGHSSIVGYALISSVEPSAPLEPTANDAVKIALSKATRVAWKGKTGETIIGIVLRRNALTMSVLPLEETDPKKYWRVPYADLTPL